MTRKSIAALIAQSDSVLADNTTGLITPVLLRTLMKDFLETIQPAYAGFQVLGTVTVAANGTFKPILWDTVPGAAQPPFSTNLGQGSVSNADICNTRHTIAFTTTCANGNNLTFAIFKNGTQTVWEQIISGNNQITNWAVSIVAVIPSTAPGDVFTVRVKNSQTNDVSITNGEWMVEQVPLRG